MKLFLKSSFFCVHWVLMPVFASLLFFSKTPQFFPENIIKAKILAVGILSIFIPVVFYFLMRNLKFIHNKHLSSFQERKTPLVFFSICLLLITNFILNSVDYFELRCFFWGYLATILVTVILCFLKKTPDLQTMGISAFLGFCLGFSYFYHLPIGYWLAVTVVISGWVFSAQLQENNSYKKLFTGAFIGLLPQLLIFGFLSGF